MGKVFSGQFDLVENEELSDYKVTSVWSVLKDIKPEWVAQANANRLLLHEAGVEINKLVIVAILRDWQQSKAKIDSTYPQTQIKRINLPVWTLEETEKYIEDRIKLLLSHENTPDKDLPLCSEEERWTKPHVYAVYKDAKAKRATKLHDNPIEATLHAQQLGGHMEERKGEDIRCMGYCDVAQHCEYWKENYGDKK